MRHGLNMFRKNADRQTDALTRFKTILARNRNFEFKHYFLRWKSATRILEVKEENEQEDGPVRLECFALKQTCRNLEQMLLKDGATPKEIAEI